MQVEIPTRSQAFTIELEPGKPAVLLGPNGAGKSRLGIYIDEAEASGPSHRIAAQRSLELPDEVFSEGFDQAMTSLRKNKADGRRRVPSPGSIAYDYDELLTALFAEHQRALEQAYEASAGSPRSKRPLTLIGRLQALWNELMPHRRLVFAERTVRAVRKDGNAKPFEGSNMSDGERLIVHVLGQALLLEPDGVLIVDEPELHMSRALLVRLWDMVEGDRSDCSFVYITHDVEFAASRRGARYYAVLDYIPPTHKEILVRTRRRTVEDRPPRWVLETLPSGSTVPRDVLVRIVGSRKPILFVEGGTDGLDQLIYQAAYDQFTIVPAGSCAQVAQLVKSFRGQEALHWLYCAGLVDGDGRSQEEGGSEQGLHALPVSEVENLFLIPDVFEALAKALSFDDADVSVRLARLERDTLDLARRDADRVCLKRTSARIWEASRSMGIKANDIADLTRLYDAMVAGTDPKAIYRNCRSDYDRTLASGDHVAILRLYDNKHGLLNVAARCLGLHGRGELVDLIARLLSRDGGDSLVAALKSVLPPIDPVA